MIIFHGNDVFMIFLRDFYRVLNLQRLELAVVALWEESKQ